MGGVWVVGCFCVLWLGCCCGGGFWVRLVGGRWAGFCRWTAHTPPPKWVIWPPGPARAGPGVGAAEVGEGLARLRLEIAWVYVSGVARLAGLTRSSDKEGLSRSP